MLRARHGLLKSLQNIRYQVVRVLNTTANPHEIVKHTHSLPLLLRDPGMRHAARHLNQTLNASQALSEGEDLGVLAEELGSGVAATHAEGQHATAHTIAVLLLSDGPVRVGVEARVVHGDNVGARLEGRSDGGGVLSGLASAEVQGLEAAVGEPRVEGGGHGADGVLEEAEAILEGLGVEGGDTHNDVAMAVDVLGNRVHDDVGAEVERVLDVRGEEGVVDDDEDAMGVGSGHDGADVDQPERGVAGGLDPHELGVLIDVLADVDLDLRREGDLDAVGLGHLGEVPVGAAVHVGHGDDVRARGERLQDGGGRGAAGREGQGILGVLERGDGLLEVVAVGVAGARVLVGTDGLADRGLGEGGRERYGLNDGARDGVLGRAGVDGEGAELVDRSRSPRRGSDWMYGAGRHGFSLLCAFEVVE